MSYDSISQPGLLDDQTIIVTGGGSNIGRYTAHELTAPGAHVVLIGYKAEELERTAGEVVEDDSSVSWHVCDIHEEGTVKTLVASILAECGAIYHPVNNTGDQYPPPLALINQKGFGTAFRINLVGGFLVARKVFDQSMNKTGDSIVNILVDMWGGMPGMGHPGTARFGMENFIRTATIEWGYAGVQVNAVTPGWVASSNMDAYESALKAVIPTLRGHVPLKRTGNGLEVAAAIAFLFSPGTVFVSGNTIHIDDTTSQGSRAFPLLKGRPGQNRAYNGFRRAYLPDVLEDQED